MSDTSFIEVSFPIPLNKTFHYRAEGGHVGSRVLAPFGPKKNLVGFVVDRTSEKPSFPTKSIVAWLDDKPFLNPTLISLSRWVSERYLCSLGEALACVVPPALAAPKRERFTEKGLPPTLPVTAPLQLMVEQERALGPILEAVGAKKYHPFLIRGITDSGKTEIYVRAMDAVITQGKQALFLLPEIALTPPFIERLRERYGVDHVGLWHSHLSGGERFRTWKAVREGTIQVLLGARSAVFAPFPNLGVIVLDEEHEPSYKQEDRPRYHTRDVALKRAELCSAVLIMGSATPSLESYWHAKQGHYTLLELTSRVEQRSLPVVELIDLRPPKKQEVSDEDKTKRTRTRGAGSPFAVFSEPLKLAIEQRLARREQIMLFVNRRGFTPFLRCSKCGWVSRCSNCSTTLSLHMGEALGHLPARYMQCHACSRREPVPIQCPQCHSMRLHQYGVGTQKVEEEIKKLFPFVKVGRLDRDIAAKRSSHESIYKAFLSGKLDILVGTQMIAKGFNFPKVTLVGVVDADVSLHLPDFRSAERTFDLMTQVAGRTGRGDAKGRVLVQTHHPEHYALEAAREHDYVGFYEKEIQDREKLRYPPFCRLVNIVLRAAKDVSARDSAEMLSEKLQAFVQDGLDILGPVPAPYSRLRNQFRYQVLIKGNDALLDPCLRFLSHYRPAKAYMSVDVDPADLL